jgi:hypothetical protein
VGLHLCYDLHLPAATPEARIVSLVGGLHECAAKLAFDRLTPIVRVEPEDPVPQNGWSFPDLSDYFRVIASITSEPYTNEWYPAGKRSETARTTAIGFAVHPGQRCEGAAFGFAAPSPVDAADWPANARVERDWHWHHCCKTQFASVVSDANLLRCHLGLVAILDEAVRLGIAVEVRDQTGYWENRDTAQLLGKVHEWNGIIARFAGAFSDAVPSSAGEVGGAILEHPEFEHLEMERRKREEGP